MTNKNAKAFWNEYNRLAELRFKNCAKMADATPEEKRRLIRENNEIMVKMDAMFN